MSTFEKIKELLSQQLNIEADKVTMEARIVDDLGADSLDVFEMLMTLEEEFEVSLPDEEAKNMKTVADLVNFIESAKK